MGGATAGSLDFILRAMRGHWMILSVGEELGVSWYLGRISKKLCGAVQGCSVCSNLCWGPASGKVALDNLGCLPKISLIRANAFCSLT